MKTKSIQWLAGRWAAARGHAKTILANPQPHGEPSTDWLTRTWADGRAHAETIRRALDGRTGRAVVLENRRLGGAPSVMTLASLLQSTRRFPAILVVCTDLIEFDRVALTEAIPCATIQVVDWCHPASPEPTDITLLGEAQLPRSLGALAGYDAATIAVFTGITSRPSGRQHQAIRALMHSASDPLFVLEGVDAPGPPRRRRSTPHRQQRPPGGRAGRPMARTAPSPQRAAHAPVPGRAARGA